MKEVLLIYLKDSPLDNIKFFVKPTFFAIINKLFLDQLRDKVSRQMLFVCPLLLVTVTGVPQN